MFRRMRTDLGGWTRNSALFGGVAWLITAAAALSEVPGFWLTETLFLLGPLVVVPVGLALIADGTVRPARPLRLAAAIQPFAAVAAAVRGLSRKDREIVMLYAWEDLPRDDIAEIMGMTRAAVDQRIHRSYLRLARVLEPMIRPTHSPPVAEEGAT